MVAIIDLISLLLNPCETIRLICSLEPAYQPYLKFGSPPFFLAMASVKMRKARDLALVVIAFGDFLRSWVLERATMGSFVFSLEVKHLVGTLLYMDHSGDPASFHAAVAKTCFEVRISTLLFTQLKNQLITASYVDDETSM
ncbi:hypothetical protein Bca52824_082863 [Brassica carinata]|uniref:Uncharacterized protein n=1 Tax=Brassica carinata TaxID=52824 RepID=A0A8X7PKL9_BRACI|nr:hypothetical protein Bca52824_082863 [Brassica carinata]